MHIFAKALFGMFNWVLNMFEIYFSDLICQLFTYYFINLFLYIFYKPLSLFQECIYWPPLVIICVCQHAFSPDIYIYIYIYIYNIYIYIYIIYMYIYICVCIYIYIYIYIYMFVCLCIIYIMYYVHI